MIDYPIDMECLSSMIDPQLVRVEQSGDLHLRPQGINVPGSVAE